MNNPKRYTITAALPYANGPLHIGHMAGVYIPADIYVRYLRARGCDVVFLCGSDEHGAAITLKAKKEGTTPQKVVDKFHHLIAKSFVDFGIEFDVFHRTSDPLHFATAQDFFKKLLEKGSFDIRTTEQYYDAEASQFLADRYITGTCPKCHSENAYGDQCENCGSTLSPQDLVNPKSTLSGATPILRETSHWYLPMEKHEDWLRTWIEEGKLNNTLHHNPAEWKKQVIGQCKSWIDGGLQARAMTRDLDWGVPVPVEGAHGKVLYVWLDAPIGYVSATKAWANEKDKDWEPYWKSGDTKLVHFLAKDNIVFHCIIFPIILKEQGDFILPDNVPANEFLNLEGKKISTSRNWAVWLHEYMNDFPGKNDELRYVLNAIAPEFRDSEFTWIDFQARVNNELVAVLGNFVNRAIVLTHKFFDGKVPSRNDIDMKNLHPVDVLGSLGQIKEEVADYIEQYRFRDAQMSMMGLARLGNKLLTETEPWKLAKTDLNSAAAVINTCLQISANLSVIAAPFLPDTSKKIAEMLNIGVSDWSMAGNPDFLTDGHIIKEASLLFERITDEEIQSQIDKLQATAQTQNTRPAAAKPAIAFDDFAKLDIRTATILSAKRIPKTEKLLELRIDTGIDQRTVVSGIAAYYDPGDLPGKKVVVLVNLEPRKIRGIDSQGMVLMAEDPSGKLAFVQPQDEIDNGSAVR